MTAQDKATVKSYFVRGSRPTQAQFVDLIDSYVDASAGTLTNGVFTNPTITGGSIASAALTNPTITNPIVTSGSFTRPTLTSATLTSPNITGGSSIGLTLTSAALTSPNITGGAITSAAVALSTPTLNDNSSLAATTAFLFNQFVGNQTLATPGSIKLPGNFILQWGTTSAGANSSASVTFHRTFADACYGVFVTPADFVSATAINAPATGQASTTGFNFYNTHSGGINAFYFAIGK